MCILRDLPQQKEPRELRCWGSYPNFICSHVPCKHFFYAKWERIVEMKRELLPLRGGSSSYAFLCILQRFGNTLGLMPSSAPPSREHTHIGTSPTT
jgi:hypothetical protein